MDLHVGVLLLMIASLPILVIGLHIGRRVSPRFCEFLAVCIVVTAAVYGNFLWQRVALAQVIPFSNLIVVANWFPLFAAFLAGLAWFRIPGSNVRKLFFSVTLYVTALYAAVFPILGESPRCGNVWSSDGFCFQTSDRTCTAASAASLLRLCEIAATEQEMADLCLTRAGTTWQGLYRGLKIKTSGTKWDVRVVRSDAEHLLQEASSPMILSVGLAANAHVDGAYVREYGWVPGLRHSVLMLGGAPGNRVRIVDPNPEIGRESWTMDELSLLYRGPALQLVPRKENPSG